MGNILSVPNHRASFTMTLPRNELMSTRLIPYMIGTCLLYTFYTIKRILRFLCLSPELLSRVIIMLRTGTTMLERAP